MGFGGQIDGSGGPMEEADQQDRAARHARQHCQTSVEVADGSTSRVGGDSSMLEEEDRSEEQKGSRALRFPSDGPL